MNKIGHLEKPADQETLAIKGQEAVSSAIKDFQTFSDLNVTGTSTIIIIQKKYEHFNVTKYLSESILKVIFKDKYNSKWWIHFYWIRFLDYI